MVRYPRQLMFAVGLGAVALLLTACGGSATVDDHAPAATSISVSFSTASPTSSTAGSTTTPTSTIAAPSPSTLQAPPAAIVGEGAACAPRGAVAVFTDGSTAYCARLQYTDASAWSRNPNLAPNPVAEQAMRQAGPQVGDQCIGADIGRTALDANGMAIVCDNYQWQADVGQEPAHPWVDDQVAWMECLEEFTQTECQEMLN